MAKKYLNKYRIESIRLKGYDYSSEGAYFITIVTKNREHFFGEIVDGKMIFNGIGIMPKNIGTKFHNIFHLFDWTKWWSCQIIFMGYYGLINWAVSVATLHATSQRGIRKTKK